MLTFFLFLLFQYDWLVCSNSTTVFYHFCYSVYKRNNANFQKVLSDHQGFANWLIFRESWPFFHSHSICSVIVGLSKKITNALHSSSTTSRLDSFSLPVLSIFSLLDLIPQPREFEKNWHNLEIEYSNSNLVKVY